jgi:hypothetical protein
MNIEEIEKAYNRLAMLHSETMAELIETRKRMDMMSSSWWLMLKHRIRMVFKKNDWSE